MERERLYGIKAIRTSSSSSKKSEEINDEALNVWSAWSINRRWLLAHREEFPVTVGIIMFSGFNDVVILDTGWDGTFYGFLKKFLQHFNVPKP